MMAGSLLFCAGLAIGLLVMRLPRSATRKAEENLRATNQELEKALGELRTTQQHVIQQERLSAIGQMASGIVHDFNNTLTPVLGFSELLLNNEALLRNPAQSRRFLEMLHASAQDAAGLVNRICQFYRTRETDAEFPAIDLTTIVQQAISLTEPKWKAQAQAQGVTIDIETVFQAAPQVTGDEAALRDVLTNLIFNSAAAMPHGGRIMIETAVESGKALLRVRDTGTGMSEAVLQRCVEPFFSTKEERGAGLGLSVVYGIIERHGGELEIDSAPEEGTTVNIRLPLAHNIVATASITQPQPGGEASRLCILVVDDDERVCEVVAEYLRGDGHEVVVATSGREAVKQVGNKIFDVVFLDRAMPEMSGDQTAEVIKQMRPELPVIMLTGFGALIEVTGSRPRAVDAVLGKPVTLATLRQTLAKFSQAA